MTAGGKRRYKALRATPVTRAAKPAMTPLKPGEPGKVSRELAARGVLPQRKRKAR